MNELITIKTLPVITQQLEARSKEIKKKTTEYLSMVCNDETVKIVKAARADLNNEKKELETQRIAMKNRYMAEYEEFLKTYKVLITDIYDEADSQLKIKIDALEDEIKALHESEVRAFYADYLLNYPAINFLPFERLGLNITKTALVENLKKQCVDIVDRIADDLDMISTQPDQAEILVEYFTSLNASQAITTVSAKHRAIEQQKAAIEAQVQAYRPAPEPEVLEPLQTIAFVYYQNENGIYGGREYSYLVPEGSFATGQTLDVETKKGTVSAQISRFGTIKDVPDHIVPFLKYLPDPDALKVPDFGQEDFGFTAVCSSHPVEPTGKATIRIAIVDTVERIDALVEMLGKMGYHYDEI